MDSCNGNQVSYFQMKETKSKTRKRAFFSGFVFQKNFPRTFSHGFFPEFFRENSQDFSINYFSVIHAVITIHMTIITQPTAMTVHVTLFKLLNMLSPKA